MDFHWASFLIGVVAGISLVVGPVLLADTIKTRRFRRREQAFAARRALARETLARLGDAPLSTLDGADGYLEAALDPDGVVRDLRPDEIARNETPDPADDAAAASVHLRLAFRAAAEAAAAALPARLLRQARHGLPDGVLLVSLHLPGSHTGEGHSVWIGQIDGTNGRRVRFHERLDND